VSLTQGDRLGPYEVLGTLGAGGMGVVYHARDSRLHRNVAIKILPAAFAADPARLRRFEYEAQALASLNHPHIAQIYGVEESGHGPALVMELVEGPTLADRISEGPVPCDDAIAIACQIADALDAAHQKGIIHRDLKPANIKLTSDGTVKVLDFGLAKLASNPASSIDPAHSPTFANPATQMGVILGTAAYMAPEQARGRIVDRRADIWAFGCVLYEMLTGRALFEGESATDIIASIIHRDADLSTLPASVPSNVRAVLRRLLQKDPKKRLRDIGDARLELEEPVDQVSPVAAAIPSRRAKPIVLGLALVAIAVALVAGWWLGGSRLTSPEQWTGTWLGGPSPAEFPRVSPDGQTLAFSAIVDGLSQVAIMKPESANWTVLTRDRLHGYATLVTWSADGTRVFFDRWFDRVPAIFSVPALGGEERLVLEGAWNPEALADGTMLVARINAERQVQLHRFWPANGNLVPLDIVFDPRNFDNPLPFRVVGNGRQIAIVGRRLADRETDAALYLLDVESGSTRAIGREIQIRGSFQGGYIPMAAAIGGSDLFIATADDDVFRVFRVPLDNSTPPTTVLVLPTLPVIDVTRDGTLYVEMRQRPMEMWHVGSTGNATSIGGPPNSDVSRASVAPLADGRLLIATRIGGREQVMVAAAGKPAVPLVDSADETSGPIAAIEGNHAAFLIGPADRREIVIASTVDGRVRSRIKAPVSQATSLAASPSGDVLYYTKDGSVYAIAAAGGEPSWIARGDSITVDPASGELVVKSDEPDRFVLTRVAPDGSDPRPIRISGSFRLVPRPVLAGAVRDGRLLLPITSSDSWYWSLGTLDLRTGAMEKLRVDQLFDVHGATWTSDGGVLAVTLGIKGPLMRFRRVGSRDD
jgi:eukaryotic-like serine/threonine-protein kinase